MTMITTIMNVGVGVFVIGGWVELPHARRFVALFTVAVDSIGGGSVPSVWMLLLLLVSFSFRCRCYNTVVIWSCLRYHVVICAQRYVLLARCHGERVAPVYHWDHVGASGQIILVSLLRGAALAILIRRSSPLFTLGNAGSLRWLSCASFRCGGEGIFL